MTRSAFLLLALLAPGDAVDEAITAFQERMASNTDLNGMRNAIAEVALKRDPRVAAALKPFLADRLPEVRVAAAEAIGEQKDPSVAALLLPLYDREEGRKEKERDVKFLCALLEGIGEADAKGKYKVLEKAARKWMDVDLEVCRAAVRSMAMARTPECVADLVGIAERCDSMIPAQTTDYWKNAYEATAKYAMDELARVTGKDIKTSKGWRDWWKENGRNWKPGGAAADPAAESDAWGDDAGTFSLKRPSKSWMKVPLDRDDDALFIAEARQEGKVVARFRLRTSDVSGLASQTASAMANEKKEFVDGLVKDQKKEQTRFGVKTSLGGENAVMHELLGRHVDYGVCFVRYVYAVHGGVMYFVNGTAPASREDPIRKEWDALFASFRFKGK